MDLKTLDCSSYAASLTESLYRCLRAPVRVARLHAGEAAT
jgi:hypothetical protein